MIFQKMGDYIDSIFVIMENNAASSTMLHQLTLIISISLVITVMIKGYATLAGKTQDPVRELIWDMVIKAVIISFVLNIDGYLTMVLDAMEGIQQWAGGGVSLYENLDKLFEKTYELASKLIHADTDIIPITGVFSAILTYLGFGLGVILPPFVKTTF